MTKSAKGTIEEPGVNVKAKSGLNRVILILRIRPFKCSKCGYISKNNRRSQSLFVCEKCSYTNNADYNASINIKNSAGHTDYACGESA